MNPTRRRLARIVFMVLGIGLGLGLGPGLDSARGEGDCPRCDWGFPKTRFSRRVRNMEELRQALTRIKPSTTLILENGVYRLDGNHLDVAVPNTVLRGKTRDPSKVIFRGGGMSEQLSALSISAPDVTIADLTVTQVGYHGVQIRGEAGASNVKIHNIHVIDVGQQLIKGSTNPQASPCRNGLVSCSTLEYTDSAPSDYTNGIDVLNGHGWTVRNNILRRIRGPRSQEYRSGPAILFWRGSQDTIVERNLLIDCYRGIAMGLAPPEAPSTAPDHTGGLVSRNAICNLNSWADDGIEVNTSPDTRVEHNTVFVAGQTPWSISIRFASASPIVRNNLCNREITLRDGAKATQTGNLVNAQESWFVDARRGDLRLARGGLPPIDAAQPAADEEKATSPQARFVGSAPDVGAFEYRGEAQ